MSTKALPNPGTHIAVCNGKMVVYQSEKGSLCVAIPFAIRSDEVNYIGKHTETIGKADGTLRTKSIDNLKRIFGWDGLNPFDLEDLEDTSTCEFELADCFHDTYTPPGENQEERITFKVGWMNPIGGSANMPAPADRKAVVAAWGSKFKAHSGSSKPATAAAKKPAAAAKPETAELPAQKAAPKPAQAGPPGRKLTAATARTSTQEEVWAALVKANPDVPEAELGDRYYEAQDKVKPGANGDMSITEWGSVAEVLSI